uniref:Uncharacterized protein n=1 Tax=Anguilla anguilla TaxID=7936 RepID=A0A0E9XGH3_ANGAN
MYHAVLACTINEMQDCSVLTLYCSVLQLNGLLRTEIVNKTDLCLTNLIMD